MRRRRLLTIKRFDLPFFLLQLLIFSYSSILFDFYGVAFSLVLSWLLFTLKKKDPDIFQVLVKAIRSNKIFVSTPEIQAIGKLEKNEPQQQEQPSPSKTKVILRTVISAIKPRRESLDFF